MTIETQPVNASQGGNEPARPVCTLVAFGQPRPQGSKGATPIYRGRGPRREFTGKVALRESSKHLSGWREAVTAAALRQTRGRDWVPLDEPLLVEMVFTLPKPVDAPKTRRVWPSKYPDASKLLRAVEDALTDAGVWTDDARVVDCVVAKRYPSEGAGALDRPGVAVKIWRRSEVNYVFNVRQA